MQSQPLRPTTSSPRLPPRLSLVGVPDSQHPPPCPVSGSTVEAQQQAPPPSAPAPEHIDAAASGCSTSCNAANSAMSRDPVGRRAIGSGGSSSRPLRTTCRFGSKKARIISTSRRILLKRHHGAARVLALQGGMEVAQGLDGLTQSPQVRCPPKRGRVKSAQNLLLAPSNTRRGIA